MIELKLQDKRKQSYDYKRVLLRVLLMYSESLNRRDYTFDGETAPFAEENKAAK